MNKDINTTIQEIKDLIQEFCDDREWGQFHDPKNLATAISIEAAELQELFLWKDKKEISEMINNDSGLRKKVEHELMDILSFTLNMANALDIDIAKNLHEKIELNNIKYPVDKARGVSTKYNKL